MPEIDVTKLYSDEFKDSKLIDPQPIDDPKPVQDTLGVKGRIEFPLRPTIPSAISSTGETEDPQEKNAQKELDSLVDHVGDMEDLTKQIEDMIDELTKDMDIPPATEQIAKAVKTLDPDGNGHITKGVYDRAQTTVDLAPLLTTGQDPVLLGLTGNGKVEGPWLNCHEVTKGIAEAFNSAKKKDYNPEDVVIDSSNSINEDFEEKKQNMILEMILMLWWNILWPRFIVDMVIINPARYMIANPFDAIVLFFKKVGDVGCFRTKSENILRKYGPVNKALTTLRKVLICKLPPKLWDEARYKPEITIDCKDAKDDCPPKPPTQQHEINDEKGSIKQMGAIMVMISQSPCANSDKLAKESVKDNPKGLGISPECLNASKTVLNAVMSDALTSGETGIESMVEEQVRGQTSERNDETGEADVTTDASRGRLTHTEVSVEITGQGSNFNGSFYTIDGVVPAYDSTTIVKSKLIVNGVSYDLDYWIDKQDRTLEGDDGTTTGTAGFALKFTSSSPYVQLRWNNTEDEDGFNLTNDDEVHLKYWELH